MTAPLLEVRDLTVSVERKSGAMDVVRNVNFSIDTGEVVGLVGESGSGKSMFASAIMGVFPSEDISITRGEVILEGVDLRTIDPERYRKVRGDRISIILQDSLSSLNPVMNIAGQIRETLLAHRTNGSSSSNGHDETDAHERIGGVRDALIEVLSSVNFPNPSERMYSYPHQLSGGMRQRAAAGMALINRPQLLIADEPTTALDVTVQAQFLQLLRQLRDDFNVAILFISHDLSVVGQVASRIVVMYGGRIMEDGPVTEVFRAPRHPYTEALIKAIPTLETHGQRLAQIPGFAPAPDRLPTGCPFRDRCDYAQPDCARVPPLEEEQGRSRHVACWFPLHETAASGRDQSE